MDNKDTSDTGLPGQSISKSIEDRRAAIESIQKQIKARLQASGDRAHVAGLFPDPDKITPSLSAFGSEETVEAYVSGYRAANDGLFAERRAREVADSGDHFRAVELYKESGDSFRLAGQHLYKAGSSLVSETVAAMGYTGLAAMKAVGGVALATANGVEIAAYATVFAASRLADRAMEMYQSAKDGLKAFLSAGKNKVTASVTELGRNIEAGHTAAKTLANDTAVSANKIGASLSVNAIAAINTAGVIARPAVDAVKAVSSSLTDAARAVMDGLAGGARHVSDVFREQREQALAKSTASEKLAGEPGRHEPEFREEPVEDGQAMR